MKVRFLELGSGLLICYFFRKRGLTVLAKMKYKYKDFLNSTTVKYPYNEVIGITKLRKIQLVVYYQCYILIG